MRKLFIFLSALFTLTSCGGVSNNTTYDYKDFTNAGGKKFDQVVTKLYGLVPDPIKSIVTREMIEEIVQSTFDQIEEYAAIQIDKLIDTGEQA